MTSSDPPPSMSLAEGGEELLHVVEVEAGGGFVEDVESTRTRARGDLRGGGRAGLIEEIGGVAASAYGVSAGGCQVAGELDALGLAAGESGGGLAEADVAQADLVENGELVDDAGDSGEVGEGLLDGHVQYVVNIFILYLISRMEDL